VKTTIGKIGHSFMSGAKYLHLLNKVEYTSIKPPRDIKYIDKYGLYIILTEINKVAVIKVDGSIELLKKFRTRKKEFIAKLKTIPDLPDLAMAISIYCCYLFNVFDGSIISRFEPYTKFLYQKNKFIMTPSFDCEICLGIWDYSVKEGDEISVTPCKPNIKLHTDKDVRLVNISEYKDNMVLIYTPSEFSADTKVMLFNIDSRDITYLDFKQSLLRKILYYGKDKIIVASADIKIYSLHTSDCVLNVTNSNSDYNIYRFNLVKRTLYAVIDLTKLVCAIYDQNGVFLNLQNKSELDIKEYSEKKSFKLINTKDDSFELILKSRELITITKCIIK
jgi:hypothetical protein